MSQLAPKVTTIGVLYKPQQSTERAGGESVSAAASGFALQATVLDASIADQIDEAFAAMVQKHLERTLCQR